jgi:hypothetical protein
MLVTMSTEPDRYEPLPSLLELPSFLIRKLSPHRRRLALAGGALLVVVLILAAVLVVPQLRDDRSDHQARAERRAAAAKAELKARYAREAQPIDGAGPAAAGLSGAAKLTARKGLVAQLQSDVLADARARSARGELHGKYRATTCATYPKQVNAPPPAEDVARATAVVECIAVRRNVSRDEQTTGSFIGQPYRARVDFAQGSYAFCKIVQQPGELSIQRDNILEVPRQCGGRG